MSGCTSLVNWLQYSITLISATGHLEVMASNTSNMAGVGVLPTLSK